MNFIIKYKKIIKIIICGILLSQCFLYLFFSTDNWSKKIFTVLLSIILSIITFLAFYIFSKIIILDNQKVKYVFLIIFSLAYIIIITNYFLSFLLHNNTTNLIFAPYVISGCYLGFLIFNF